MDANSAQEVVNKVEETKEQLPAKTGFWPKLGSILFREVNVTLTPRQQKMEDTLNKHFGLSEKQQKIIDRIKAFWLQEINFGKNKKEKKND